MENEEEFVKLVAEAVRSENFTGTIEVPGEILQPTYTMDQILKIEEDTFKEEQPVKIKAMPKNSFLKGDKFKAKDFSWRIEYDDDGAEDVDVTDDDVEFTPTVAEKGGKLKLNINFKSTGKYAKFQTIQTTVDVIDPSEEDIALKTAKKVNVSVEASDVLQKYSIHLIKTDQDGKRNLPEQNLP